MKNPFLLVLATVAIVFASAAHAERFTIAAASDLRFALDDIAELYRQQHPDHEFNVIYGSSGKMTTQIMNGAPYDVFFSADIAFPERLKEAGLTATEPEVYAIGRIVIWSNTLDASELRLEDLPTDPRIRRVAIAQPSHAPYGLRAQEAMESVEVWEAVQPRLVFGENIAHTAQMVESGAANVGIIALSLARFPSLAMHPYYLIDDGLHNPLSQAYIVTRRAKENDAAKSFARYMEIDEAHEIMERYGFVMPGSDSDG
ncbi:Molybdenum ABC transporter, periplasmic molybdenum-binding protein ModA [Thioalkalivibrio nitratireducens DSM 14787]|uniref:Molybdenum ABC transporter, periplasmic molybdenum-binding protein ModA n=1 Tax=Thioalkalivibrio nitratireducens (strain DSM 14787 / UNIQEM 213 / ALEN2) TaxID=1255043 RepID=L0DWB5_THIND|nr:molybdate ABC transporter substrate-binding protein [Thioalkalivibrio nitratireducens]AGA32656.1 Molybdenum ABC transporter, periplasmic molybdenum-binding protein ModA [Thioalkalivibrio nitratireducens DSM 14787]